jgi:2-keto-4-pentenoate hydratase
MSTPDTTAKAAEILNAIDRQQQLAPFTGIELPEAYGIVAEMRRRRTARGEKVAGRKIGFTNRTLWERYGVHEPMWGSVYDRTLISASSNKATVDLAGLVQPRIEPEIAFRLKAAPPVTKDPEALLRAIEWIAHAIEIVQCHHADWKVSIADCTADNGLHGRLIVGTPVPVENISGLSAALPFLRMKLMKNGEVKDQGVGSNVLGSPLLALAFLLELLNRQNEPLAAGEIITTGTLTDAHPVAPGETWSTDTHGFACRGLEVTFK